MFVIESYLTRQDPSDKDMFHQKLASEILLGQAEWGEVLNNFKSVVVPELLLKNIILAAIESSTSLKTSYYMIDHALRENLLRAHTHVLDAYVELGYIDMSSLIVSLRKEPENVLPTYMVAFEESSFIQDVGWESAAILTLGYTFHPKEIGGPESELEKLQSFRLFNLPPEFVENCRRVIAGDKRVAELTRMITNGAIIKAREESNDPTLAKTWYGKKLSKYKRGLINIRFLWALYRALMRDKVGAVIANYSEGGIVNVNGKEIYVRGAANFIEPLVNSLGGEIYSADEWKDPSMFEKYAEQHGVIKLAWIPIDRWSILKAIRVEVQKTLRSKHVGQRMEDFEHDLHLGENLHEDEKLNPELLALTEH